MKARRHGLTGRAAWASARAATRPSAAMASVAGNLRGGSTATPGKPSQTTADGRSIIRFEAGRRN